MTFRETSFREPSFRENDYPGNVLPGKWLSGKVTFRETSVNRNNDISDAFTSVTAWNTPAVFLRNCHSTRYIFNRGLIHRHNGSRHHLWDLLWARSPVCGYTSNCRWLGTPDLHTGHSVLIQQIFLNFPAQPSQNLIKFARNVAWTSRWYPAKFLLYFKLFLR